MSEEGGKAFNLIERAAGILGALLGLGGAFYTAIDYFATKAEVNQLRCEMNLHTDRSSALMKAANFSDILKDSQSESYSIKRKTRQTEDDRKILTNLDTYQDNLRSDIKKNNDIAEEASKKLEKADCHLKK